jgi:hypothetical protein
MFKHILNSLLPSIAACLLFFTASCSKDPAIPSSNPPKAVRKILIEKFTGHYDGHGVIASDTFQNIQQRYPGNVIGITIHSGYLAKVFPAPFDADFHCNEGDSYSNFMGVTVNPIGTVNRIGYPNRVLKNYTREWSTLTDSMIGLPAVATLKITNQYNSTTRLLNTSVQCNFLGSLTGNYKLVVLLTEDNVIAPQKDYTLPDPHIAFQFSQRHVLRDGITGTWGDLLNTGPVTKTDSVIKNYSYNLPVTFNGMAPNANHCHVIAYIYNTSTYEVLQAEEMKIMD